MKKIINIIGLFLLAVTLCNCEEETYFKDSDIEKVPVYSVTNMMGQNAPYMLNVYQSIPLTIEYATEVNPKNYESLNYTDNSEGVNVDVSWEVEKEIQRSDLDGDGEADSEVYFDQYDLTGSSETQTGTLIVISNYQDGSQSSMEYQNVKIQDTLVYN